MAVIVFTTISCAKLDRINTLSNDNNELYAALEKLKNSNKKSVEQAILVKIVQQKIANNEDKLAKKLSRRGTKKIISTTESFLKK